VLFRRFRNTASGVAADDASNNLNNESDDIHVVLPFFPGGAYE
jgi:hypothetical protein